MNRVRDMSVIKRWLAALAALLAVSVAAVAFGALSITVQETGDGADPSESFSSSEDVARSFLAEVTWRAAEPGAEPPVDRATQDDLADAWLRALDALERAASGDTGGVDVWFVGATADALSARFALDTVGHADTPRYRSHELSIRFASDDGQIVALAARSTTADERVVELVAHLVVSDGNWRISTLERR